LTRSGITGNVNARSADAYFGDDFIDDPMVSFSITGLRRKARFMTATIERLPEVANAHCKRNSR
jgi:hypothetical protein